MKKISMGYIPEAGTSGFPELGIALSNYVYGNTERIVKQGGGVFEGKGPGKRMIRIKLNLKARPENNVHDIEISDPISENEDRLLSELQAIYKGFGFSRLQ